MWKRLGTHWIFLYSHQCFSQFVSRLSHDFETYRCTAGHLGRQLVGKDAGGTCIVVRNDAPHDATSDDLRQPGCFQDMEVMANGARRCSQSVRDLPGCSRLILNNTQDARAYGIADGFELLEGVDNQLGR